MNEKETLKNIEKTLKGILLVLLEGRDEKFEENKKVEVLLNEAGFERPEIAKILNKNLQAVQKAIIRTKKKHGK